MQPALPPCQGGPVGGTYLVECYWPGVTTSALTDVGERAGAVTRELRTLGHDVRFLGSLLVPVDEVVFCRFAGASAGEVGWAGALARIPADRIVECVELPADPDHGG